MGYCKKLMIGPLAAMLLPAMEAEAHFFSESADCAPPKKPLQFVTELDQTEFDRKVESYRACLEAFVNRQNQAMEKHKVAADQAAATWKSYVETVLEKKIKSPDTEQSVTDQPAPSAASEAAPGN